MRTYRGIQIADSVRLIRKDGSYNKAVKRSLDKLADRLERDNDVLLSTYINGRSNLKIRFNCNHVVEIQTSNYNLGRSCPKCGHMKINRNKYNNSKREFFRILDKNGHRLLSDYKGDKNKVLISYGCNHKPYQIQPRSYKQSHKGGIVKGCPICNTSKGERIIYEWLQKNNIPFHHEYIFPIKKVTIVTIIIISLCIGMIIVERFTKLSKDSL